MHVIKTNFRGNPNVGLYVYVTDQYCLVGPEVPEEDYKRLEQIFEVPVHRITIAGTGLLGVFMAGTSSHLLIPMITLPRELEALDKLGIQYTVIDATQTALGNNIVCNDHGCLVSDEYTAAEQMEIGKALGMRAKPFRIGELSIIGSCCLATNKGCLVHRNAEEFEIQMLEETLKVPVMAGTINLGSPYVKGGIAVNSHGMITGDLSGGPEIVNAEEAFIGGR